MFKMKKKPVAPKKPVRESNIKICEDLYGGELIKDLFEGVPREYRDVAKISEEDYNCGCYNNCGCPTDKLCLVYYRPENDREFNIRMNRYDTNYSSYKKRLEDYNIWYSKNKKQIEIFNIKEKEKKIKTEEDRIVRLQKELDKAKGKLESTR